MSWTEGTFTVTALLDSKLWWEGPTWLSQDISTWPIHGVSQRKQLPELKVSVLITRPSPSLNPLWKTFSSFHHLVRVLSWIRRFVRNVRADSSKRIMSEFLQSDELYDARIFLLQTAQMESYSDVLEAFCLKKPLPKSNPLSKFDVSMNSDHFLTASGRVRDFNFPLSPRSLVVLSLNSSLTQLFISTFHVTYKHPGISAFLSIVSENYHMPGLRNFAKLVSRQCPLCQRAYAKPLNQRMGLLPEERTTPAPPFFHTGMDFAGPFILRKGHTRKPAYVKKYACLFVCFTTKVVHLELCEDLTTEEFMAALRRFCARRGTPQQLFSDNGKNFIGARNEIKQLQNMLTSKSTLQAFSHFCTTSTIQWKLTPPRAPHFGGLWEAGVRSMKTLLRKLTKSHTLTFVEMTTVLTEVEAILNSRPLSPVNSTDVDAPH